MRLPVLLISLLLASTGAALATSAPENDDRSAARALDPVSEGTVVQSTFGATLGPDDPLGNPRMGSTVWFKLELGGLFVNVHTRGSGFDTMLCVYVEEADGSLRLAVRCEDDTIGYGLSSSVDFFARPGQTYLIQAGGWYGATGELHLTVRGAAAAEPVPVADAHLPGEPDVDGGECWAVAPAQTSCTTGEHTPYWAWMHIDWSDYTGRIESTATWLGGEQTVWCEVYHEGSREDVECDWSGDIMPFDVPFTHTCRSLNRVTLEAGGEGAFACSVRS